MKFRTESDNIVVETKQETVEFSGNVLPVETLVRDMGTGLIVESDSLEKIVTFRTSTFLRIMNRLVELLGYSLAGNLMGQIGMEVGRNVVDYTKVSVKTDGDLVSALDQAFSERGWGRCLVIEKDKNRPVTYRVTIEGNPIASKQGANQVCCRFIMGIYVGFLQLYLDKKAKSYVQYACVGLGAPNCIFDISFE